MSAKDSYDMDVPYNTKTFPFEIKEVDETDATGEFTGYASVFDNVDLGNEIVERGAFARTINSSKGKVPVLWSHNPYIPAIGQGLEMEEDKKGLLIKAQLNLDQQLARDVYSNMKKGITNGLSIGYDIIVDEWDKRNSVHRLKELKLWEYSVVTFPMNPKARSTSVKRNDYKMSAAKLYDLLEWCDEEMKAGRTLSRRNEGLVQNAIEALQALLEASNSSSDSDSDDEKTKQLESALWTDVDSLVKEMKSLHESLSV